MKKFVKILKKIVSVLKLRSFWFVIIIYPVLYYLSQWVWEVASGIAEDHRAYFGFLTFFAFSILIVLTSLEIIARLFKHELQGAKLKIREGEGVSLEMDSRERE